MENLITIHSYNAITGKETKRELTPEEVAQYEKSIADARLIVIPDAD